MKRKTWSRTFKFWHYAMIFELAPKNTVWSIRLKENSQSPNQRIDALFSLERAYISSLSTYVYALKIGRFQILFANTLQGRTA